METWKDIPGYEGLYMVSDHGRVKSFDRWVNRSIGPFLKKGRLMTGCKSGSHGYHAVNLCKTHGVYESYLVHRLVATAFIPNPENKPVINHRDFNRLNNHVSNLEWATDKENIDYTRTHGNMNQARGEQITRAIFTEEDVRLIKQMMRNGKRNCEIRKLMNVNRSVISHIRNGRIWKHVTL